MLRDYHDHFLNPLNTGEIADAAAVGSAGDMACGAVFRLSLSFQGDRIVQAKFLASGSSGAIAAGSILTQSIEGQSWRQAAALPAGEVAAAVRRQPSLAAMDGPQAVTAAQFAIEALHAALEDSLKRGTFPQAAAIDSGAVLLGMSGGVDSSVACLLLKQAGRRVVGVTLRLWSDPACSAESGVSCCSPQAIREARAVCHSLGLPHLTLDYSEAFAELVVDNFVAEYLAGRTPNPCTRCNGRFRFPELVRLADRLGAARVATGHYVGLVDGDPGIHLARGGDQGKDQSYMLWGLDRALLARLEFPLARLRKKQTRSLAREAGLAAYARPESQEVCFIPDDDYRRFLRDRVPSLPGQGDILSSAGSRLGRHDGFLNYTVGQRRGLGLSAPEPLFVLRTVPEHNLVIVGGRNELAVRSLRLRDCNYFVELRPGTELLVQVRYNSSPLPARLDTQDDSGLGLTLLEPAFGVAPGQSAVLYRGDTVLAGGIIAAAASDAQLGLK